MPLWHAHDNRLSSLSFLPLRCIVCPLPALACPLPFNPSLFYPFQLALHCYLLLSPCLPLSCCCNSANGQGLPNMPKGATQSKSKGARPMQTSNGSAQKAMLGKACYSMISSGSSGPPQPSLSCAVMTHTSKRWSKLSTATGRSCPSRTYAEGLSSSGTQLQQGRRRGLESGAVKQ